MFFAVDEEGNRVSIDDALDDKKYYCEICGEEVIKRRGAIREYHFAHRANSECDPWNYDMSEWHREWQEKFSIQNREVVIKYNNEMHRADVLIDDTVIEFQHSPMSNYEFWERNKFYTNAGYKLVWLFDMTTDVLSDHIVENRDKEGIYKYKYHSHTFDMFHPKEQNNIKLFFQLSDEFESTEIGKIIWFSPDHKHFMIEGSCSYSENEFLDIFIADQNVCDDKDIYSIANLYDELNEMKINGYWCVKCPQKQVNVGFEECGVCNYSTESTRSNSIGNKFRGGLVRESRINSEHSIGCVYRFKDILEEWNVEKDKIIDIEIDNCGMIRKVQFSSGGTIYSKDYSSEEKNLLDLLKETDAKVVIARNIITGTKVKIGNSFNKIEVTRIYGYFYNKLKNEYYKDRREIFGWNKPEWVIDWELKE